MQCWCNVLLRDGKVELVALTNRPDTARALQYLVLNTGGLPCGWYYHFDTFCETASTVPTEEIRFHTSSKACWCAHIEILVPAYISISAHRRGIWHWSHAQALDSKGNLVVLKNPPALACELPYLIITTGRLLIADFRTLVDHFVSYRDWTRRKILFWNFRRLDDALS